MRLVDSLGFSFKVETKLINKMPLKQVEFLFGHEVLHVVYDHMGRNGERDRKIANIAADFCVNADLIEQRVTYGIIIDCGGIELVVILLFVFGINTFAAEIIHASVSS